MSGPFDLKQSLIDAMMGSYRAISPREASAEVIPMDTEATNLTERTRRYGQESPNGTLLSRYAEILREAENRPAKVQVWANPENLERYKLINKGTHGLYDFPLGGKYGSIGVGPRVQAYDERNDPRLNTLAHELVHFLSSKHIPSSLLPNPFESLPWKKGIHEVVYGLTGQGGGMNVNVPSQSGILDYEPIPGWREGASTGINLDRLSGLMESALPGSTTASPYIPNISKPNPLSPSGESWESHYRRQAQEAYDKAMASYQEKTKGK